MVQSSGTKLKERILAAAREMLAEEGPGALSTRRIAGAVGVSATSLYLHFDSKDALLHALVAEGLDSLGHVLETARQKAPVGEKLKAMALAYVRFGMARPQEYELMFLLTPSQMRGYPADKYRSARSNLEQLAEVLREESPSPPNADRELLEATTLWSSLHGLVALLLADRIDRRIDRDQLLNATIERALPQNTHRPSASATTSTRPS